MRFRFFNTFEPVSSFYRDLLPYLAQKHRADIEVYISDSEYRTGRGSLEKAVKHPRVRFVFMKSGKTGVNGRWRKIKTMLTYCFGATLKSIFGEKTCLNFFLSQPPLFAIWGYFLKVFRRQPYCCLIMDLYPDVAIQDGLPVLFLPFKRMLIWISRFTLNHADSVIVIGRCMRDHLYRTGVGRSDIQVMTNWANEQTIFPVPREQNTLRRELDLTDDFIILYSGNMGVSHLFTDILEVARRLQGRNGLKFVFIGDGVKRKEILKAKEEYSLDNIIMLPYQPIDNLSMSISLGDIHFVSLRPGFEGLLVPSKAYGAMAAGCPILYQGSNHGEIARMVTEERCGTAVEPDNAEMLETAILEYYRNPDLVDEQGRKSYELSQGRFGRKWALSKYYCLLSGLRR
jgi:colanic acid biosynthesis glycosyl transferase WcaI